MSAPATTGVNEDLLRRVLEHITAHPEEHEQREFGVRTACGTAYCLAGHVVVDAGHELHWTPVTGDGTGVTRSPVPGATAVVLGRLPNQDLVSETARKLLGLDLNDAWDLFDGGNSLDDLWRIAAELTDGRVSRPVATTPTK